MPINDVPDMWAVEPWQPHTPASGNRGTQIVATRALRALVVDDNHDAADSSAVLLGLWGHDVRVAYHGTAALEAAADFQPDVFLLDIGMPGMSGNELAKRFRLRFPDALLIAVTGYADTGHRALGEESGFDVYLAKPVPPPILETLLMLEFNRLTKIRGPRHRVPATPRSVEVTEHLSRQVRFRREREPATC